jgi:hypothetical protein
MQPESGQVHVVRFAVAVQNRENIAQPSHALWRHAPLRPSFVQRFEAAMPKRTDLAAAYAVVCRLSSDTQIDPISYRNIVSSARATALSRGRAGVRWLLRQINRAVARARNLPDTHAMFSPDRLQEKRLIFSLFSD